MNKTLQKIDLCNNEISDVGIFIFMINIIGDNLSIAGAEQVSRAILINTSLIDIEGIY
jgi:hypothetical protein